MKVPPMTTGLPSRMSSLRRRSCVTYAVPQPSLTMSMYGPAVSSTSSQPRVPRPLSMTCVRPPARGGSPRSKPVNERLQLLGRSFLHVVKERVAVRVDPDPERTEILHAELPQALGHELLPVHLFDFLDLGRLERGGAADDGEIDHSVLAHGLDRLVREPALSADRAHAVLLA